jgi:hypothetical protein
LDEDEGRRKATPKPTLFGIVDNESKALGLRGQILIRIEANPDITKREMSQEFGL